MTTLVTEKDGCGDANLSANAKSPEDVKAFIKKNNLKIVDLKFNDLPGLWQHTSFPAEDFFKDNVWKEGLGFDGSSIRGFKKIQESDMVLMPDPTTAVIDPICEVPTLSIICDIYDPITREPYSRDPRYIAKKAEEYLKKTKLGDQSYWGPEAEFFIFDSIRFDQGENFGYYYIDSKEGDWNTGKDENPNLGYKCRYKEGYFPVPPHDTLMDIRSEMMLLLRQVGVPIECHHHEVATAGQCEVDIRYSPLVKMADQLLMYKYVVKNVARRHNKTVTFMPKPIFSDNGSGMHVHSSIWKEDKNTFYDSKGYALISENCKYYIGGILKHAAAILAFAAPTTNSYKRLVPGYEAPVNLVYSARNRSAAIRIPMYSSAPSSKRIEFRCPDPSCNPYLVFPAILLAGLDGIINKIDPGPAIDRNIYELDEKEKVNIKTVPGSLSESLDALEKDHEFLLQGDVFTKDVIDTWIDYKRSVDIAQVQLRPHPHEFYLYFDV
ncbi:MAG: type I glutamate--ammonia ligase [Omnitrophica bacterium RIFCSPLOWO2_12_FULL_44_17]|uniref:Glutamine synthetase n=1 Tax=Candidatus Danuiimicrobium aquiferis TaxID=1801832 RepID=A0A1G1KSS3_9BACT|nr:MAG: type I glutamate--ammonia ligase [Omnitrophica bacterium RIFCSPHIGHO2_02_FULL_45_28]OGW90121.1 MAG: type I glutamate--ammonia ligase [Omnitrophica bacterium RIFCSPHIGHO2_12_FULL_44_12]OGW95895.1 MAG: type I glutamate--ammonia ligase [Omnitrophica bacterium RIFCSPLOWO2_12_FULL_44_17]OGX01894.1 MAG: type I glutamate--ammonia ligase [Omnitrophica bacterium RIFCSPLOWO2_02_FULL_44_11]